MSRREKLLRRFLMKPSDFSWDDMRTLLRGFGYKEIKTGKSSGSRVAFLSRAEGHIIRLHKPHPGGIMKRYQLEWVEEALRARGIIR